MAATAPVLPSQPLAERRERWDAMMEPIPRNDIHAWCAAFVESLQATRPAA